MNETHRSWLAALIVSLVLVLPGLAQQKSDKDSGDNKKDKQASTEKIVKTQHSITIAGKKLAYTATAGNLLLKDDNDKVTANVFFIAYTLDNQEASQRPLTFAFNGGPGSSSVWLHLGVLGPRRVLVTKNDEPLPPPYRIVDNEATLLDQTDLVLIDPVSTGYSRPATQEAAKKFHGVQQDVESVGEFIRLYLTRYQRWNSPKFLAGESYGTTRAAGLSAHLQNRHGITLNGIMLISSVLNFQTIRPDEGNDLPYLLFLPSYTATAWYHKRLPMQADSLREVLAQAEKFAAEDYNVALMKGSKLSAEQRRAIAQRLSQLTGLSEEYVLLSNLRIQPQRFMRELLRDQRRTVGRYDSRYTGRDGDAAGERPNYDPSFSVVQAPYTSALNYYIRQELKYESDLTYEILTGKVHPWDYGSAKNRYLNVADELRDAMTESPYMKVFVANGYYDLATPYFATEYTFSHLGIDPSLEKNIHMGYYEAGHMMYVHLPSLQRLKSDLSRFIQSALSTQPATLEKTAK